MFYKEAASAVFLCYYNAHMLSSEKTETNKTTCSYCGEAPVNHTFYYLGKLIFTRIDSHMASVSASAPRFLKIFADYIPIFIFNALRKFGLGHFSSDVEKASSFRSRVIWEEAERRGIVMEQVILGGIYVDWYRARFGNRTIYFESIPIAREFLYSKKDWDDKIVLKEELGRHGLPVPKHEGLSLLSLQHPEDIFSKLPKPVIVKPQSGSRARHTVTNIGTLEHFKKAITIAGEISPYLVVEEHLVGYICRATVIGGKLAGFYRGSVPRVIGDGVKTIRELIDQKNSTQIERYHVRLKPELHDHIARFGFFIDDVLPAGVPLSLSHRAGQLFGGHTKEMIDELHQSFIPIIEKAASVVGLSVIGFDCIIPDPTGDAGSQRWGIIECNTLPFIDVHYYALEGKPRNIAGMIWDLWN